MSPELAAVIQDQKLIELLVWVSSLLITLCIALVAAIWRSQQKTVDWIKAQMEAAASTVATHDAEIKGIRDKCLQRDGSRIDENGMRKIMREELDRFRTDITDSIKLKFLEEGYIKQSSAAKRTSVKKKT